MSNATERIPPPITPLEAVMRRMGGSSGFPALATTMTDINRIVGSELDSVTKLTRAILRDVSLTNKLLQVVNSATYGQFRGHIHTVSKAVLILGFEAVRNTVTSLVMLEFSKGKAQAQTMHDEIVGAFFAGVVSKSVCEKLGIRNGEEAVICTMFHSLGRLLAIFFLYEESQQVNAFMAGGLSEEEASAKVLGISYRELGVGIAKAWNFPDRLVTGMQKIATRDIKAASNDAERLKLVANLANELCDTALHTTEATKQAALETLARRYGSAAKFNAEDLTKAIQSGLDEIKERALTLNIVVKRSATLDTIKTWAGQVEAEPVALSVAAVESDIDSIMHDVNALEATDDGIAEQDPAQILASGIRDVTETLVTDFALNDILQMVLETMYRGMSFSRTMIFIRDNKAGTMRARFGFGRDIELVLPKCNFPLAFAPDVFHVALDKGADIVIEDALAPNIVSRIPQWYHAAITSKSFLLLPVMVKGKALGLFYADADDAKGIKVNMELLGLLRTLRNQAVLAIQQKM